MRCGEIRNPGTEYEDDDEDEVNQGFPNFYRTRRRPLTRTRHWLFSGNSAGEVKRSSHILTLCCKAIESRRRAGSCLGDDQSVRP